MARPGGRNRPEHNHDGPVLATVAAELMARPAGDRLLLVVSDGRPSGPGAGEDLLERAVQAIAAQVFDAPVEVPEPGEYVARGAAVQAAWALTGDRPGWQVPTAATPAPDYRPEIREQYANAADAYRD